jgi:hypothetical protein
MHLCDATTKVPIPRTRTRDPTPGVSDRRLARCCRVTSLHYIRHLGRQKPSYEFSCDMALGTPVRSRLRSVVRRARSHQSSVTSQSWYSRAARTDSSRARRVMATASRPVQAECSSGRINSVRSPRRQAPGRAEGACSGRHQPLGPGQFASDDRASPVEVSCARPSRGPLCMTWRSTARCRAAPRSCELTPNR